MVLAVPPIRKTHVGGSSRRPACFSLRKHPVSPSLHSGLSPVGYDFALANGDELVSYTLQKPRKLAIPYYTPKSHLFSVAATTNRFGNVVERYSYTAYGQQTVKNSVGAVIAKSAVNQDRGFTGYRFDAETGFCFARARMYAPRLGRFIGRDSSPRGIGDRVEGRDRSSVRSGMGYHDGFGLYDAYFVPSGLDPSGLEDFPVDCGTVSINITGDNIAWSFTRVPEKKCCCASTGWINHGSAPAFDPPWRFDNGAYSRPSSTDGGGNGGMGAPSDPRLPNQPVQRPPGQTGGGMDRWRQNPWFPSNDDDSANPQPHDSGSDASTRPSAGDRNGNTKFVLQLVCQDTGKVLFSYTITVPPAGNPITGRNTSRP